MNYRELGRTKLKLSALSFGASSFGNAFQPVRQEACQRTLEVVLEGGINFIDVSPAYGQTLAETRLGQCLKGVPRQRYYLGTKVGSYDESISDFDYSAARTRDSFRQSLDRLGVDYLDLVQCHDIEFADHDQIVNETLPVLHEFKAAGLVNFIGITGLPLSIYPSILDRVPHGTVDVILSYCHYTLQNRTLERLLPYLAEKEVGAINAAPTAMGLLTPKGPPDWHPATAEIRTACAKAVEYCRARKIDIVKLAIQFACANPAIATTLVGAADPDIMRRNVQWAGETPDPREVEAVSRILAPVLDQTWTREGARHGDLPDSFGKDNQ